MAGPRRRVSEYSFEALAVWQVDDGKRGSTSKECIGQGLGNFFAGLTSGMGGCALIGQSLINVQSGGTSRLSGITMSAFLGLGIFAAAPLLGQVPVASLVGVMLLVCYSTFSWSSLRIMRKIPKTDAFIGEERVTRTRTITTRGPRNAPLFTGWTNPYLY